MRSAFLSHIHRVAAEGIDDDPQHWFKSFYLADGLENFLSVLKDGVASLKLIGFSVAFAATAAYITGYLISNSPQKREDYKSRVLVLYMLVMLLFGGLAVADILYDVAKAIGG